MSVQSARRLVILLVVMALALGAILVRLVDLQGVQRDHLAALGLRQRVYAVTLAAERGSIFDRNGNDLALSLPQHSVYADPRFVKHPAAYAATLGPIVGVDVAALQARLAQKDKEFVYVARKVDDATVQRVKALRLPGLGFVPESKRFAPAGNLAGPILGFTGLDNGGQSGLEHAYDDTLRGRPGHLVAENDPSGREIPATERRAVPAQRGGDLVLTVDQSLQYEVEQRLTEQVGATQAKGGMAIVVDVQTGDVLAMATVEGANGRIPAHPAPQTSQNRALTTVYEPGSTNKVIDVASALETGAITPSTAFEVPWQLKIADATFEDHVWHAPEWWTARDIMRESSNVGAILIAGKVGKVRLDQYLRAFGFGAKTAIDFPGESAGLLLDPARYSASSMGSVPVGNGLAVTAMQMLDVFVTIANGGMSRPPRLVAATIDADGTRHDATPVAGQRVVSTQTAASVNDMLRTVVDEGTGYLAAVPGYTVAGKTGTARKPPYNPARYMASFAGFAPAESPRLAAIVVLDEPATNYYGGQVAAPVFAEIMQYALRLERVSPTIPMSVRPHRRDTTVSNDAPPPPPTATTAPPAPVTARSPGNVVQTGP